MTTSRSSDSVTGPVLIDRIGEQVTLDTVLDRDPFAKPISDEELRRQIVNLRQERATFETKTEARRQKRKETKNDKERNDN